MNLRTVYMSLRILALLVGLFLVGTKCAHAVDNYASADQAVQFAACKATLAGYPEPYGPRYSGGLPYTFECKQDYEAGQGDYYIIFLTANGAPVFDRFHFSVWACDPHEAFDEETGACPDDAPTAEECAANTSTLVVPVGEGNTTPPPSICMDGCTVSYESNTEGGGGIVTECDVVGQNCHYNYTTAGAAFFAAQAPGDPRFDPTCTIGEVPGSTETDADADGIPDGDDSDTNDSDSDGTPDAEDSAPNDPDNGEGEDGESDNTSTGGGNCSTPPVSSGDGIATQIAYQAWATRCEVEKLNKQGVTVKGGSVVVAGGGSTEEYEGEFGDVTAGIPAEGVDAGDAFGEVSAETGIEAGFDDSGFLSESRSCPALPVITMPAFFGGHVIDLNERFVLFCTLMEYAGMFIWLFAALASLKIYARVFS